MIEAPGPSGTGADGGVIYMTTSSSVSLFASTVTNIQGAISGGVIYSSASSSVINNVEFSNIQCL